METQRDMSLPARWKKEVHSIARSFDTNLQQARGAVSELSASWVFEAFEGKLALGKRTLLYSLQDQLNLTIILTEAERDLVESYLYECLVQSESHEKYEAFWDNKDVEAILLLFLSICLEHCLQVERALKLLPGSSSPERRQEITEGLRALLIIHGSIIQHRSQL